MVSPAQWSAYLKWVADNTADVREAFFMAVRLFFLYVADDATCVNRTVAKSSLMIARKFYLGDSAEATPISEPVFFMDVESSEVRGPIAAEWEVFSCIVNDWVPHEDGRPMYEYKIVTELDDRILDLRLEPDRACRLRAAALDVIVNLFLDPGMWSVGRPVPDVVDAVLRGLSSCS